MEETTTATEQATEVQLSPEDQAKLDDRNVLFFGIVPVVLIVVLAIAAGVVYYVRRRKNWNELDNEMKIDDGDKPVTSDESFNTRDIAEMEPTRPSQRITELSRHKSRSE
jgi:hypothetical protein